jgi:hypothetical protein
MENNPNSRFWKWIVIAIGIGLAIFFSWGAVREYKLSNNHRFTIATTLGHGGGGSVDFEFKVNGVIYKRGDRGKQLITNGRRYFVKYYVPDPSQLAKVISNEEVPDCIGEPPPDGWKEIPKCK